MIQGMAVKGQRFFLIRYTQLIEAYNASGVAISWLWLLLSLYSLSKKLADESSASLS